jgi:methylenetetrahydrofolate dehydrogenase (NADP+)/methenyltetrahydrofolate cyclohydrolase
VYLLKKELGDLTGKTALIIGRGKLVGRPLFDMLLAENCTVTMAHSKTEGLEGMTQHGFDIIVCAVGKPKFLNLQLCNAQIVVDVGVNRDENGKLCGDCWGFSKNWRTDMKVTPVPKGIGLMTRAMLIKHIHETMK